MFLYNIEGTYIILKTYKTWNNNKLIKTILLPLKIFNILWNDNMVYENNVCIFMYIYIIL